MLSVIINGEHRRYEYDSRGYLVKTFFEDGSEQLRLPDDVGNLYESISRKDRTYGSGGRLEKQGKWRFKYDDKGNLIKKSQFWGDTWKYEWNSAGMLEKVIRPDKQEVTLKYDALGRRIEKTFGNIVTKWLWNENVPLHEWTEYHIRDYNQESGEFVRVEKHPVVTWVFEEGTFVPVAKLTAKESYSIITNYMGTPEAMYDSCGEQTWSCDLDSYGRVRKHSGNLCDCPFRYQGQYEDEETGLYYNRFRFYDPNTGNYINQDPLSIEGGLNVYAYVYDTNAGIDPSGLSQTYWLEKSLRAAGRPLQPGQTAHHIVQIHNSSKYADLSRKLLARHGLDPDIAANGARLWGTHPNQRSLPNHPGKTSAVNMGNYHAGKHIHSPENDKQIYRILRKAEKKGLDIEKVLGDIGKRMEEGTWKNSIGCD